MTRTERKIGKENKKIGNNNNTKFIDSFYKFVWNQKHRCFQTYNIFHDESNHTKFILQLVCHKVLENPQNILLS